MTTLLRHWRPAVASLAVLGVVLTATAAAFSDTSDTTTTITAGTVDVVVNADATDGTPARTPITVTTQPNGKDGWTSTQTFTIQNTGSLPVLITAAAPTVTNLAGNPGVGDQIEAALTSAGGAGVTITGGPALSSVGATVSTLGISAGKAYTIAAGSTDTVTLTLSTPSGLTDTYQGSSIQIDWTLNSIAA